jgi:hypothetical protein
MNAPQATVTQLPTMCINPEGLTHAELKLHVLRLQGHIADMGLRLHSITAIATDQAVLLHALADSFDAKDKDAVEMQLQRFSKHRSEVRAKQAKAKQAAQMAH